MKVNYTYQEAVDMLQFIIQQDHHTKDINVVIESPIKESKSDNIICSFSSSVPCLKCGKIGFHTPIESVAQKSVESYITHIPLEPADIPIHSWIQEKGQLTYCCAIIGIGEIGVRVIQHGCLEPEWISFKKLQEYYNIQRPDGKGWVRCEKSQT